MRDGTLDGYVNVDIRETGTVADLIADLNDPKLPEGETADAFFSHAFFEHLMRDSRVPHLKALRAASRRTASPATSACRFPPRGGAVPAGRARGDRADVRPYHVYRYTHGDPEHKIGWEAQLHKSLFDVDEVGRLVRDAGFASYVVFRYVYPGDADALDLSLGFFATAHQRSTEELERDCRAYLADFDGRFLRLDTLRFEDGRSRPATLARGARDAPQVRPAAGLFWPRAWRATRTRPRARSRRPRATSDPRSSGAPPTARTSGAGTPRRATTRPASAP